VPRLADRGEYLASESTFYRLLKAENQLAHRHAERPPKARRKPKAVSATVPNQVYSWDISYLPTAIRGQFFYLYLLLDWFSRKIVGWQVYEAESSVLASELLNDICRREAIAPHQVTLHSDNGSPMKGATMLATLQALLGHGVVQPARRQQRQSLFGIPLQDLRNTVPTTRPNHLPIWPRPAVGSMALCAGITMSTATVPSAASPRRSVMPASTRRF
jgi:transposase InsO family protein